MPRSNVNLNFIDVLLLFRAMSKSILNSSQSISKVLSSKNEKERGVWMSTEMIDIVDVSSRDWKVALRLGRTFFFYYFSPTLPHFVTA